MSNKRNISTILGVAGATVLAAGGSAFVTNTGMSLADPNKTTIQESEAVLDEKETEAPLQVETFVATKDSFTIKPASADTKKDNTDTAAGTTADGSSQAEGGTASSGGSSSEGGSSGSGSSEGGSGSSSASSGGSSTSSGGYYDDKGNYYDGSGGYTDPNGLYHDEWGGYYAANGDYYDGQGGYYDGDGYHKVSSSSGSSSSGSSSSGSSSSGSSSSGSSSSGAWDDSYILSDVNSRYLTADDLSGWSAGELAILRNEIFARHGRIFKTQKWRDYFATKTWYVPQYENVDSLLNDCEWRNLDLIMKLEDQLG